MPLPRKFWFKLQQLKAAWLEAFPQKRQHYDSTFRMCPHCRGLIDRDATECPLCGGSTRAPRSRNQNPGTPGRVLGVIPVPSSATAVLVAVNILLYGITWYMTQEQASATLTEAPAFGGVSGQVLYRLGETYGGWVLAGQWWRLVTAMFLHAGLLHIGMNMWVLFDVGPVAEQLFSTTKFTVFYFVTGLAGFLASGLFTYNHSVGASGAIMGVIGALIGVSFHHGGLGKEYRSQLLRWVMYILVIGVVMHADNAAHIGGLVTGIGLGYFVPEGESGTRAGETLWNTLAILSVLIIAGSFALMALQLGQPLR